MSDFRRYSEVAEIYERVRAPITGAVAADLVAAAEPAAGARVLDIGTGTGVGVEAASSPVPGVVAVGADRSIEMLSVGRRIRPGLRLLAADASQLPFRAETFDVALANFVLAEFTRYDTALFDLIRVLRRGGRLAAAVWALDEDELTKTWRELVEEMIGAEMLRSAREEATPWAERFGNAADLEQTLRDAGLHPVRVENRSYRFAMTRDDYIQEQATRSLGRFLRAMVGESEWASFLEHARRAYETAFPAHLEDSRDVLVAVGTKP